MLQSVTECYKALQSVTECYRVLQSVKECYRVFLAHLLGPISGLVMIDTAPNFLGTQNSDRELKKREFQICNFRHE